MHYVYLLRSESHPTKTYIGVTSDLRARLKKHNEGGSKHTAKYTPWKLTCYHAFDSKDRAQEFERYLKIRLRPSLCKKTLLVGLHSHTLPRQTLTSPLSSAPSL